LVFVVTHVIFDETTATGPPSSLPFVEMQDAQGYVARCTTLSTSSFCLVVWSARPFVENINNTNNTNNYTDAIVLTEA
jgi:hypothetical protein